MWHCFFCGLKGKALGYVLKTKYILHEFLSAHCELTVHCEDVPTPKQQTQGKQWHTVFSAHWKEEGLTVDMNKWTDNFNSVYIDNLRAPIISIHHVNTIHNVVAEEVYWNLKNICICVNIIKIFFNSSNFKKYS